MPADIPLTTAPSSGIDHLPWEHYRGANRHFGEMRAIAISPDGARLAFGCGTTYASAAPEKKSAVTVVVDLASGAEIKRLPGSRGTVYAIAFAPDGSRLASYDVRYPFSGASGGQRAVRIWDLATGEQVASKACAFHTTVSWRGLEQHSSCRVLRWPRAGRLFTADGTRIGLWSDKLKPSGQIELDIPSITSPPSQMEDRVVAFDASPDGERVAVAGARRGLRILPAKAAAGADSRTREGLFADVAFNPTGTLVAAIEAGEPAAEEGEGMGLRSMPPPESRARPKRVTVLSAEDLSPRFSVPVEGNVQRIAFSPDGGALYGADATGSRVVVRQWRATDGASLGALAHRLKHRKDPDHGQIDGEDTFVRGLAVSGEIVAAVTGFGVWLFRPRP